MNDKLFKRDTHSDLCFFELEDEVDCAILGDHDFEDAMCHLDDPDYARRHPTIKEEEIEVVDTSIDYDDNVPECDMVGMDADDIISAERDMVFDPCDDEVDIAIDSCASCDCE